MTDVDMEQELRRSKMQAQARVGNRPGFTSKPEANHPNQYVTQATPPKPSQLNQPSRAPLQDAGPGKGEEPPRFPANQPNQPTQLRL